ncbi:MULTISPECIES: acyl-CoA dehydrogenase family protein [Streptomyces]|uniref:acyl-CoA dehydrogenase family protein n=1 Tax=Streptomyces TaxID=1883 RepID=UPI00017E8F54|nr:MULTISPECIES: acyl-CoA dehydrogenase family protein [Streptomyces]AKL71149.1 acyl-CoA dehydrogenase [Streptomyces sp. Mg1]EDX26149.1 acyl-CoA dehydrogenase [Streptomyces sp. Mg1]WBY24885.1 acyl-CoA dehydrogenase family protein [Streptomyces goshikiensis]WSS04051.1 acyl-CoA dehydrogenase family protein [Streptomyces goshikiensis]
MTTTLPETFTGPVAPPEPDLTPDEIVARAEELASTLVERQAETERRGYYAEDTHEAFSRAGFYRILVPRQYGGYEFGPATFLKVATALARGCPSTGWMYLFGAAHALVVGTLFDERTQAELFAGGDFICPATVAPAGTATRTGDGWLLDGTWNYCSGAPYATHFIGHSLVFSDPDQPPAPLLFIAPREKFERLEDWGDQLGLKGSGSHSIRIEQARIPAHHALIGHLSQIPVTEETPGRLLHGPEYGGGPLSFMLLELGALAVGIAKGGLDAYEELMRSRTTAFFPIVARTEDPDFQFRFGEATGLIAAAEAAVNDAVRQWQELCLKEAAAFTREEELRLATISREAVRLCWRAVEGQLFPTAGSSSVRAGHRIERVWRDLSTLHSHAGNGIFLATHANRELARAHFGTGQ